MAEDQEKGVGARGLAGARRRGGPGGRGSETPPPEAPGGSLLANCAIMKHLADVLSGQSQGGPNWQPTCASNDLKEIAKASTECIFHAGEALLITFSLMLRHRTSSNFLTQIAVQKKVGRVNATNAGCATMYPRILEFYDEDAFCGDEGF